MEPVSRRSLLRGGLATAALAATSLPVLSGCSTPTAGTSNAKTTQKSAAALLPTYRKYAQVKPDLVGTDLILDGFLSYPDKPIRAIEETPGDGKTVTFMTNIPGAIPPTEDRNSFWQALNKRIGSPLEISMASNDEYPEKFATRIAGDDLPDVINIPPSTAQLPGLLQAKCQDLTEHLAGDAVLKYPFLANLPAEAWKGCIYNGAIWGVPIPRGMARTALPLYREDLLSAKGIKDPAPSNFQEFLDLCKELTDAKSRRWAWASAPTNYVKQMLDIPYLWKQEGGKFTSANESEQMKTALDSTRKLVAAGVVNPDAFGSGASQQKQWFNGGIVCFVLDSFVAWNQFYADNTAGDAFAVNMLDVPGFDGGEGTPWLGLALNNITAFNKDNEHSTETLLKLANWMSASFGTEEYLFRKYGLPGSHYTMQGSDPVPSRNGVTETGIGLQYFGDAPMALYLAGKPDVVRKQYAIQQKITPRLVKDASYGLYSDTKDRRSGQIDGVLNDLATQIILGRQPVADWDEGVKVWLSNGGEAIRGELEKSYAETARSTGTK